MFDFLLSVLDKSKVVPTWKRFYIYSVSLCVFRNNKQTVDIGVYAFWSISHLVPDLDCHFAIPSKSLICGDRVLDAINLCILFYNWQFKVIQQLQTIFLFRN